MSKKVKTPKKAGSARTDNSRAARRKRSGTPAPKRVVAPVSEPVLAVAQTPEVLRERNPDGTVNLPTREL